ncbi:hypothetical protein OAM01_01150 [bacterium]|nr:hypothetical protein [bacterium]
MKHLKVGSCGAPRHAILAAYTSPARAQLGPIETSINLLAIQNTQHGSIRSTFIYFSSDKLEHPDVWWNK